jgi:hypothetical protein
MNPRGLVKPVAIVVRYLIKDREGRFAVGATNKSFVSPDPAVSEVHNRLESHFEREWKRDLVAARGALGTHKMQPLREFFTSHYPRTP